MELNTAVYGEKTLWDLGNGVSFYVGANGSLNTLINNGKISLNTPFDQSVIYATTSASHFKQYCAPVIDNYKAQKYQNFWCDDIIGMIMTYCPAGGNPANLFWTSSSYRDNPFYVYNGVGYGMKKYGNNPYGDGARLIDPRFIVGYNWKNWRFFIQVYCTNLLRAESVDNIDDIRIVKVELQKYLDNVNNVATANPDIIGADISPCFYNSIYNASLLINFYATLNTSTNSIEPISQVTNDIFYLNQARAGLLLGTDRWLVNYSATLAIPLIMGVDNKLFKIAKIAYGKTEPRTRSTYVTRLIGDPKQLIKAFAYLGIPMTTNENDARYASFDSGKVYAMDLDDSGKTDGILKSGNDLNNIVQSNWTDDILTNNNFNGIDKVDPNNYTDKIDLNKPTLTPVDVFNRSYAINAATVRNFADFLWNADETKFNEIIKGLGLMGENPINGVIDLRLYPFNVATKNGVTTAEEIAIGRVATGINGIKLTNSVNSIIDLGECSFFTKFENFLDYEPYTTAQLYIPYIGVVPVSTAEFMGHNISVKMIVDYVTGACCAIVFKDDIPFIYRNGVIGVDIPITGTNSAQFANSVIGNVITGAESALGAVTSGNITGMVTGGISALENIYSAFTTPTMYQTAGASSPAVANWQPQNCYFIIDLPETNVPNSYGHNVGYACEYTDTLGNCSGFTVCGNPTINFKCTSEEQKMLTELLKSGVYI